MNQTLRREDVFFSFFFFCHSRFYTGNLLTLRAAHTAWQRTYSTHIQPYTRSGGASIYLMIQIGHSSSAHWIFRSSSYRWILRSQKKKRNAGIGWESILEKGINVVRRRLGKVLFWKDSNNRIFNKLSFEGKRNVPLSYYNHVFCNGEKYWKSIFLCVVSLVT